MTALALQAIDILDRSEVLVRDAVERGLMNDAGTFKGKYAGAQVVADRVVKQVADIRLTAMRDAIQHIVDGLDGENRVVLDHTLSQWGAAIASTELSKIDGVIRRGLRGGYDNAQIAAMVIGTVRHNGRDGMTEASRRHIMSLVRTSEGTNK